MEILYENSQIVVIIKPSGLPSQETATENAVSILRKMTGYDIFPVHRLDTLTSGIMVYAKSKEAAAFLSKEIQENRFNKTYIAAVHGDVSPDKDILTDLLFKDSRKNKSFVVKRERKGVKKASLEYEVIEKKNGLTLLKIKLYTGRTHQIRVQLASRKHPVYGDGKYGSNANLPFIALRSHEISFIEPISRKQVTFTAPMPEWNFI